MISNGHLINEQLKIILDKLRGCSIYGMQINEDDKDMLIVAAYYLARSETQQQAYDHEMRIIEILGGSR